MKFDSVIPIALGFGIGTNISIITTSESVPKIIVSVVAIILFVLAIIGRVQDLNQKYKGGTNNIGTK